MTFGRPSHSRCLQTCDGRLSTVDRSRRDAAIVIANRPLALIGEWYLANGYVVFAPTTPLDVIQALVLNRDRIGVVVLSREARWADGLLEFLAEEYPEIDRVVLRS